MPRSRSGSLVLRIARNLTGSRSAGSKVRDSGVIGPSDADDPMTISVHATAGKTAKPLSGCGTYATVSLAPARSLEIKLATS